MDLVQIVQQQLGSVVLSLLWQGRMITSEKKGPPPSYNAHTRPPLLTPQHWHAYIKYAHIFRAKTRNASSRVFTMHVLTYTHTHTQM